MGRRKKEVVHQQKVEPLLEDLKVEFDEKERKLKIELNSIAYGILQLEADKRKMTMEEFLEATLKQKINSLQE